MQRSIELLDKVLSEYDEHETEGEGDGDGDGDGGGGGVGLGDCGSSTEPSIGLTPDDESPSLGIPSFFPIFILFSYPFPSFPIKEKKDGQIQQKVPRRKFRIPIQV